MGNLFARRSLTRRLGLWQIGLGGLAIALTVLPIAPAWARPSLTAEQIAVLFADPLDMALFQPNNRPYDTEDVITSQDISQAGLTLPSLWWAQEQYGGRLLEDWAAFPASVDLPPRVDVAVNEQVWGIYNYIERYSFVNRFGTEAQEYGYVTRIFNRRGELLSAYLCDYSRIASGEVLVQENCSILLDAGGRDGLSGQASPGVLPTTGDDRFAQ